MTKGVDIMLPGGAAEEAAAVSLVLRAEDAAIEDAHWLNAAELDASQREADEFHRRARRSSFFFGDRE